jgi:hypothetical protein
MLSAKARAGSRSFEVLVRPSRHILMTFKSPRVRAFLGSKDAGSETILSEIELKDERSSFGFFCKAKKTTSRSAHEQEKAKSIFFIVGISESLHNL